jgi:hypothetical protein
LSWGRQQPAPDEFMDGCCSATETVLEFELVDRRRFFRRQHDVKTLGTLTIRAPIIQRSNPALASCSARSRAMDIQNETSEAIQVIAFICLVALLMYLSMIWL